MRAGFDRKMAPPVVVIILVLAGTLYGHLRLDEERQTLSTAKRAIVGETTRARAARLALAADRQYLEDNQEALAAMHASGFLDPQDRLMLTQAVEALGVAHRFNRIRVSVEPEQVVRDLSAASDMMVLVSTPVLVTLDAARQQDVLDFLDALPGLFSGVPIVETVQIRGVSEERSGSEAGPTAITAQIALRWQTLRAVSERASLATAGQ